MFISSSTPDSFTWLDLLSVIFSGAAALGGVVAVIIAVRALTIARESAAVEQLFVSFAEVLAAIQGIGRIGGKLGRLLDGEVRSREAIADTFQTFLAARARADLALEALGLRGDYSDSTLNLAHNFAAGIMQADEFGALSRELAADDLIDHSWVDDLSWRPSGPDTDVLAQSMSFQEVRHSKELVSPGVSQLHGLDKWWGERITEDDGYAHERSVYSIKASYLTQTSRLLDDYTREYVQPMFAAAVRRAARSRRRMSPLI